MESDIIKEYKRLISRQSEIYSLLQTLPKGYISKKSINGKNYYYRQYRTGSSVSSHFIKSEQVSDLSKQMAMRKQLEEEKKTISCRISELEKAGSMISRSLYQKMRRVKLSEAMDTLSLQQRERSLSFSDALTAIEGVPVSEEAKQHQIDWKNGKITFDTLLTDTLIRYGFPVGG